MAAVARWTGAAARRVVAVAATAAALVGASAIGGVTPAASATDPMLSALQQVYGPVSLTTTVGGPTHNGREPAEWANFSGVKDQNRGVLYRTDQITCPPTPHYERDCATPSTWTWDPIGRSWDPVPGAVEPGARLAASSAALSAGEGGQAWIYSGNDHVNGPPYDAKAFVLGDDGHWSAASCNPSCAIGQIDGAVGAASPTDSLQFGGDDAGPPPAPSFYQDGYSNTVFRWTGTDWAVLPVSGPPPPARAAAGFAFDGEDFILFSGGFASGAPTPTFSDYTDTWRLHKGADGIWSWQKVCDACGPSGRHQMTMSGLWKPGDSRRGVLMVGGQAFNRGARFDPSAPPTDEFALSDVWAWDGRGWTQVRAEATPCDVSPPSGEACWADPAVKFAPFSASMPAVGAAVWTEGSCTGYGGGSVGTFLQQQCTRNTVQVVLEIPSPTPSPTPAPTPTPTVPTSTAAPAIVNPSAVASLPVTGPRRESGLLAGAGISLVLGGGAMVAAGRRRRRRRPQ